MNERYSGGGIREHILKMSTTAAKLKSMKMGVDDDFLVHLIFSSLPKEYDNFVVNYNMQPDRWDIEKLIAMCVQEEERLKSSHNDYTHLVKDNNKKKRNLSGMVAPPPSHREKPIRMLQDPREFKLMGTNASFAKKGATIKRIAQVS